MARAPLTGEVARLWGEIVAAPDDDGVRAVLADLLMADGDPRGELVSLQLLPAEDAAALERQQRIQALLRDHAGRWLGPLRSIAVAARFERGFLGALELDVKWPADSPRWERPVANRTLLTVTELPQPGYAYPYTLSGEERGAVYARFVTSPAMAALRRIEVFDRGSVEAFETCAAPLTHVSCVLRPSYEADGGLIAMRVLPECARRDTITSLAVHGDVFPLLQARRWFERLTTITVACEARRGLALWPRIPTQATLVVVSSPGIEPCFVAFPWDFRIELTREANAVIARIAGEWVLQPLHALAALPREVSRIEIEHTSALMARRVSEAVARPGIEIVVRAPRRAGNLRWT
ncbi:MAG TPA: hypothetical protein VNO30_41415 [Kofleriaceae bacterium]|nr:hypothetical protein [Kofleriaceae bacterium]